MKACEQCLSGTCRYRMKGSGSLLLLRRTAVCTGRSGADAPQSSFRALPAKQLLHTLARCARTLGHLSNAPGVPRLLKHAERVEASLFTFLRIPPLLFNGSNYRYKIKQLHHPEGFHPRVRSGGPSMNERSQSFTSEESSSLSKMSFSAIPRCHISMSFR